MSTSKLPTVKIIGHFFTRKKCGFEPVWTSII
jgi:hypothetical protein